MFELLNVRTRARWEMVVFMFLVAPIQLSRCARSRQKANSKYDLRMLGCSTQLNTRYVSVFVWMNLIPASHD